MCRYALKKRIWGDNRFRAENRTLHNLSVFEERLAIRYTFYILLNIFRSMVQDMKLRCLNRKMWSRTILMLTHLKHEVVETLLVDTLECLLQLKGEFH